jgi:hypothetical protein
VEFFDAWDELRDRNKRRLPDMQSCHCWLGVVFAATAVAASDAPHMAVPISESALRRQYGNRSFIVILPVFPMLASLRATKPPQTIGRGFPTTITPAMRWK